MVFGEVDASELARVVGVVERDVVEAGRGNDTLFEYEISRRYDSDIPSFQSHPYPDLEDDIREDVFYPGDDSSGRGTFAIAWRMPFK